LTRIFGHILLYAYQKEEKKKRDLYEKIYTKLYKKKKDKKRSRIIKYAIITIIA